MPIVLLTSFGRVPGHRPHGVRRGADQAAAARPGLPGAGRRGHRSGPTGSDRREAHTAAALRILVADDHPVNQRLVLLQLAQLGHHADLVSNGAEAVTAVRRRPYDVVLMDVRMPELDGPAATRLIHAELGDRSPWIIAVTADALPGTRDACLAAGMDDYLTKPLVAADLARALARAGDRSERDGTADATTVASRSDGSPVLDPAALDTCASWSAGTRRRCPAWWPTSWPRPRRSCTNCGTRWPAAIPSARTGPRTRSRAWERPSGPRRWRSCASGPRRTAPPSETGGRDRRRARARRARPAPAGRAGLGNHFPAASLHESGFPATPGAVRAGVWPSLGHRLAAPCSLVCRGQRRPRHPEDPHGRGCLR